MENNCFFMHLDRKRTGQHLHKKIRVLQDMISNMKCGIRDETILARLRKLEDHVKELQIFSQELQMKT